MCFSEKPKCARRCGESTVFKRCGFDVKQTICWNGHHAGAKARFLRNDIGLICRNVPGSEARARFYENYNFPQTPPFDALDALEASQIHPRTWKTCSVHALGDPWMYATLGREHDFRRCRFKCTKSALAMIYRNMHHAGARAPFFDSSFWRPQIHARKTLFSTCKNTEF